MDKLKRIEESRKNIHRLYPPLNVCFSKLKSSDLLFDAINRKFSDVKLLNEAKSQYIIGQVTAFEVYLKDTLRYLMSHKIIDKEKLVENYKKKFSLSELEHIKEKKITIGELIVDSYNFQKLYDIEKAYSLAFNLNFFKALRQFKQYKEPTSGKIIPIKLDNDFYSKLEKLIKLRHNCVHDVNYRLPEKEEIEILADNLFGFILALELFIAHREENKNLFKS